MPSSRTQISCPNCRQPVVVELQQVFDMNEDPTAKQRLLAGAANFVRCPHCGYQGNVSTPIVYHDPAKELLLTYVPSELGLPRDEQERALGKLINQVVNRLPQEKRRAYLLKPETILTYQRLIERVLEADGITKEMIQAQQERLNLVQRLLNASEDVRQEIVQQEDELVDGQFFALLGRLIDASQLSGDQESWQHLRDLQADVLQASTYGRQIQEQTEEIEAAIESLREVGEELTRERLLDLILEAPSDIRLRALVSLARPAIDYMFFQMLSERIERNQGEEREELTRLRGRLLELTHEIDQQVEAHRAQAKELVDELIAADDIREATLQNLPAIDEFFVEALNQEMESARRKGDLARMDNLKQIVEALREASEPPPEIGLIQDLLEAPDDQALLELLEGRSDEVTPELLEALSALLAQSQAGGDEEMAERLRAINRIVVRQAMKANLGRD